MPLAICATPIGNLDDVTLRVLDELRAADVVLCEDTRRTRILLSRHGVEALLESHHRHNEAARTPHVLARLRVGKRVALVSDAGLPGVNDPGARLIAAAVAAGVEVLHAPREWPEYHPGYYAVFLRDPDGHNVEFVCHAA
jgi:16S rRNA (cytidine1402-2'-O)-methyltransferase